jgi:hypothetical protein
MDQDIALRQRKRLGVSVRNTHKSRPALTRMWRDIISVIVVHDDGRVGNVSVGWIRCLDESVFTGTKRRHGGVDYPQTRQGSGYLRSRLLACMCIVHCAVPALGTAIMSTGRRASVRLSARGRDSQSRLRTEYRVIEQCSFAMQQFFFLLFRVSCSLPKVNYEGLLGTSPVVVFQLCPSQLPLQAQSQSVFEMIFFCAAINAGIGHIPSASSGHPSMPVRGAMASFITTRICSLSREGQESTADLQFSRT